MDIPDSVLFRPLPDWTCPECCTRNRSTWSTCRNAECRAAKPEWDVYQTKMLRKLRTRRRRAMVRMMRRIFASIPEENEENELNAGDSDGGQSECGDGRCCDSAHEGAVDEVAGSDAPGNAAVVLDENFALSLLPSNLLEWDDDRDCMGCMWCGKIDRHSVWFWCERCQWCCSGFGARL